MRVFLSWSGNSRGIAEVLCRWLPQVLQPLDPWMSTEDIAKGARSLQAIDDALLSTTAGIVCVTRENQNAPWLAFEAGMLARDRERSRVSAFLVDLKPTDLAPSPLSMLQATVCRQEDVLRLVKSLNDALGEGNRVPADRLERSFEKWWPDLEGEIAEIDLSVDEPTPPASTDEVLELLLTTAKETQERLVRMDSRLLPPDTQVEDRVRQAEGRLTMFAEDNEIPSLAKRLEASDHVWLLGQSLSNMTESQMGTFTDFVSRGGKINAMVLDSRDELLMDIAGRSLYAITSPQDLSSDILDSLVRLSQLGLAATDGAVHIRTLKSIPAFSAVATESNDGGEISVEIYPFKASATTRPRFMLRGNDAWHGYFKNQIESLWDSASTVSVTNDIALADDVG